MESKTPNNPSNKREEMIITLKCAREVMEVLESKNMSILVSQANQVYIKNNENGLLVCLNDMRDSFNVIVEREK